MKLKYLILGMALTMLALPGLSQVGGDRQNVETIRIGFMTKKLNLSPEEAQGFWPVYNQYQAEMKEIKIKMRKDFRAAKGQFDTMSDKEVESLVDEMMELKQAEMETTVKYHSEFKKVLPIRKVAKLYKAEQEFTKMLIQRLNNSQNGPRGQNRPGGGRRR